MQLKICLSETFSINNRRLISIDYLIFPASLLCLPLPDTPFHT